jgi:hypothetical protein
VAPERPPDARARSVRARCSRGAPWRLVVPPRDGYRNLPTEDDTPGEKKSTTAGGASAARERLVDQAPGASQPEQTCPSL